MRRFVSIKIARCSRFVASAAGCSLLRAFVVRCSPSRPADSAAHAGALGGVSFPFTHRAPNPAFEPTASSYARGRGSTRTLGVSNTSMRRFVSIKSARCSRLVARAAGCSLRRVFVVRCSPSRPAAWLHTSGPSAVSPFPSPTERLTRRSRRRPTAAPELNR